MCGITGILYRDPSKPVEAALLRQMNNTLTARGPDDAGLFVEGPVGLAMRRLSIIDVAGGRQPLTNEDQSVIVVCNGEIYNFKELKAKLIAKGHRFYTHSDVEVIPHLYEEKGPAFLNDLNGMFALALWDTKTKTLLLARDRMGKKPLYYSLTPDGIIFGSEIKALLAFPGLSKEIDRTALEKYLAYEYIPAPRSIFKNIFKLPAGHFALWKNGKLETKKYWEVPFIASGNLPHNIQEAEEELRLRLRNAVRRRLMSDVPLGALLSGGVDSSIVVALMAELLPAKQIKTFSIGFEEASFDESNFAKQIASHFGVDHHQEILSAGKMLDILPEVTAYMDEPLADPSILPTYLLSKFTRSQVTVALGGDGGDELFAGYPTFIASRYAKIYEKFPRFFRKNLIEAVIRRLPVKTDYFSLDFKLKKFIQGIDYPLPIRHCVWTGAFDPQELAALLGRPIKAEKLYDEALAYHALSGAAETGNRELFLYEKLYLQDDILTKVDRASMACSLEVRAPFLDKEVVEWVSLLPYKWKLKGLTTKHILKKAFADKLPKNILQRPKQGFAIPVAAWLKNELKEKVYETLEPSKIRREGFFNPAVVQKLVQEHQAGKANHYQKLWTLLMFEWWLEKWGLSGG